MQIHVVQRGETLWLISRRYNVTICPIVQANELPNPDQLVVGQALVIPIRDQMHVVKPCENLWMIARRYGTTVESIVRANRIVNPSLIYAGQVLRIPKPPQPTVEVNGYLTQTGTTGQQIVRKVGDRLTYLSLFTYGIRSDGTLIPINDTAVLETAKEERVAPLLVIANFIGRKFSSELAHTLLTSTDIQDKLIGNILDTMKSKGYRGLNIDFEYVLPEDRERYNQFLRRVVSRLRPEGYSVSTALAPKVKAEQIGLLYEAHNYPAHGEIVDFTVIMTYEYGWAGGPPLAIAPINEVRRALDYAVSAIPRSKILMGVPLYGRDWTLPFVKGGPYAPTIRPQEAILRAVKYGADIQYHSLYQSPFFRYTDEQGREHEVWFEDARSIEAKFDTVDEYGLRGVSYWEISSPFPQNWLVLEDHYQTRKIPGP
ncbi:LysM peptidoglycan-binding domain-containing protein [Effusibacillus consociatus]|uniref:LysM peptidoglycan-binding domain-containing protein n=1 Tax=Effusibacillus consociatus TaxID=1117041 RepID=A0ABV9Q097_9BACL